MCSDALEAVPGFRPASQPVEHHTVRGNERINTFAEVVFIYICSAREKAPLRASDILHETISRRRTDAGFNRGCSGGPHFLSRFLVWNLKFICVSKTRYCDCVSI